MNRIVAKEKDKSFHLENKDYNWQLGTQRIGIYHVLSKNKDRWNTSEEDANIFQDYKSKQATINT